MNQQTAFMTVFGAALQRQPLPDIAAELWPDILEIADRQHVYALVSSKLAELPAFCASEHYERGLQKAVRHTLEQEKRDAQFLRLYKALKAKGLHPLAMKGLVCRAAYGELGSLRPSGDEDLMISPAEFWQAWQVLEECAYQPSAKEKPTCVERIHHVGFRNDGGHMVELHVHPIGVENSFLQRMDQCFDGAFSRATVLKWKGADVDTLCPTDHYLLLIFHLAKHFCSMGFGVRPLADIAVYSTRYAGEIRMEEVYAALEACRLMQLYRDLVYIANKQLGFCLPEAGEPLCPESLVAHMLDGGVLGPRNSTGLVTSVMVMSSFKEEHRFGKALWHVVCPSRKELLRVHPEYAGKPIQWLLHYPRRWMRGFRTMLGPGRTSPVRSLQSSRERLELLQRYGIG